MDSEDLVDNAKNRQLYRAKVFKDKKLGVLPFYAGERDHITVESYPMYNEVEQGNWVYSEFQGTHTFYMKHHKYFPDTTRHIAPPEEVAILKMKGLL